MDLAPALNEITREDPGIQAVYLFGSMASGDEVADSDVDIAVLAPQKFDAEARWRLQERIAVRLGRSVDLVDLRSASTVMQIEVLRSGQLVLDASPGARALFEATALGAYARLNESRAGILADVEQRGSVHG